MSDEDKEESDSSMKDESYVPSSKKKKDEDDDMDLSVSSNDTILKDLLKGGTNKRKAETPAGASGKGKRKSRMSPTEEAENEKDLQERNQKERDN